MAERTITRDVLIAEARAVAAKLGRDTISAAEFERESQIGRWYVEKNFDSWNDLVVAAGLVPYTSNLKIDDEALLRTLRDAFVSGGGILTRAKFRRVSNRSWHVYVRRWGGWTQTLVAFRLWAEANDPSFLYLDALPTAQERGVEDATAPTTEQHSPERHVNWQASSRTKLGAFLNFRGLQHAPVNEQGVVFLFGMVALDLRYIVEGVGTGFPDCEAKRSVSSSGDAWERVRIEFEFKSRNFLDHGHRPEGCDVLVCWDHNWADCPLEVLELRSAIETLPND